MEVEVKETDEITHVDQLSTLAFLKDVLGFDPISDGEVVITDYALKIQAYAGIPAHARKFEDGYEFSEWVNTHTGAETKSVGENIFWGKLSDETRFKIRKYLFFHTKEQIHCSVYSHKAFNKAW